MVNTTITKIEEKIRESETINKDNKKELLRLLSDLKSEVSALRENREDDARSIAHFAEISAHETTRKEKNPNLIKSSLEGLTASIEGLEVSHPKLTETVNSIARILSNMGI
ncbi:MAG: DUF4404 family protein [bacterium]